MADQFHIPTFEEWERRNESKQHGTKRVRSVVYDPKTENLPDHRFFRLDRKRIDKSFHDIALQVLNILGKARSEDKQLIALRKLALESQKIQVPNALDVAMVGQQGMGKSLAINALQHRPKLSSTSARGGACTATAIKFRNKPDAGDSSQLFDAIIRFMSDSELREIIGEHVRRLFHFEFSGNVDSEYYDEEQRAAESAKDFLYQVHNAYLDRQAESNLKALMTAATIQNGRLMEFSMLKAQERIGETDAGEGRTIYFKNKKIEELMEDIEAYIAEQKNAPSLWPIVEANEILMSSLLTVNGVYLADLPGLNDINQTRMAAANAVRRKAGLELIVGLAHRVLTDGIVDQYLRESIRAHGAKGTVLVLTKKDEYLQDDPSILNEISTQTVHPFPTVKFYLSQNEVEMDTIEAEDGDLAELNRRLAYEEDIKTLAKVAFIEQRAKEVEEKMKYKFTDIDSHPIAVHSISASMYMAWLQKRRKQDPVLTPTMTGIPGLRKFLLENCADGNWEIYTKHAFDKLDELIEKCRRITDNDRKGSAFVLLRPAFIQHCERLKNRLHTMFDDFLRKSLIRVWSVKSEKSERLQEVIDVVHGWSDRVAAQTYNKALREGGIVRKTQAAKYVPAGKKYGSFNWNEEISTATEPTMNEWKREMDAAVTAFARDLDNAIIDASGNILGSIQNSPLTPELRDIAVEEWNKRQDKIFAQSKRADNILKEAVRLTHQHATTETDSRCMIARVNAPDYEKINDIVYEKGWTSRYAKQSHDMPPTMQNPDSKGRTLLDRIASAVTKNAKKTLRDAFAKFLEDLVKEIELFNEHIGDRIPTDYALTDLDRQLREEVVRAIPKLEKMVAAVRSEFTKVDLKEEQIEESSAEPASKKIKLEEPGWDFLEVPDAFSEPEV